MKFFLIIYFLITFNLSSNAVADIKLDQEFEDYTVKNYYASFEILFFIYELTDDIEYLCEGLELWHDMESFLKNFYSKI